MKPVGDRRNDDNMFERQRNPKFRLFVLSVWPCGRSIKIEKCLYCACSLNESEENALKS